MLQFQTSGRWICAASKRTDRRAFPTSSVMWLRKWMSTISKWLVWFSRKCAPETEKAIIPSIEIVWFPCNKKIFEVTDASKYAIPALIKQDYNDCWQAAAFMSNTPNLQDKKFTLLTTLNCFWIMETQRNWWFFLYRIKYTVRIDYHQLWYLRTQNISHPREVRWLEWTILFYFNAMTFKRKIKVSRWWYLQPEIESNRYNEYTKGLLNHISGEVYSVANKHSVRNTSGWTENQKHF